MGRYSVTIVLRFDKLLDKTQPISPLDVNILHRQRNFVEFCPNSIRKNAFSESVCCFSSSSQSWFSSSITSSVNSFSNRKLKML